MTGTSNSRWAHTIAIGSITISLRGFESKLSQDLDEKYGAFLDNRPARYQIDLTLLPRPRGTGSPYDMEASIHGSSIRLSSPVLEGTFDIDSGLGQLAVCPHPEFGAGVYIENALRQISQVIAITTGGFLLHAAAVCAPGEITVDVFPGESGSGKTTISSLLQEVGAVVVSDDLVLVEIGDGEPRVRSTPFFGSLRAVPPGPVGDSFSVSRLWFLEKSEQASVRRLEHSPLVLARLLTNVPFAGCLDRLRREQLIHAVTRFMTAVEIGQLRFRRDLSFLPLIGRRPDPMSPSLRPEALGMVTA